MKNQTKVRLLSSNARIGPSFQHLETSGNVSPGFIFMVQQLGSAQRKENATSRSAKMLTKLVENPKEALVAGEGCEQNEMI